MKYLSCILIFATLAVLAGTSRHDNFVGTTFVGDTFVGNTSMTAGNLQLSGNTIISTDTDGDVIVDPDGTGDIQLVGPMIFNGAITLPALTNNRAMILDGTGILTNSAVTDTELGRLAGVGSVLCGIDDTCTLINKTFNSTVNILTENALRFQDASGGEYMGFKAPATLSVSTTFTWPNGDGAVGQSLTTDGSGILSWEAGGGAGGLNYIKNIDYEGSSDDVLVSANITKSLETVDPLRGAQSIKLVISTSATTADFIDLQMNDIDNFDQDGSRILNISFDYYTDANFSTDDVQVVLRRLDATAADIILHDNLSGKILASSEKIRFTSRVEVESDANSYALRINVLVAPSSDSALYIDTPKVGPDVLVPGAIITEWEAYTPVISWVTNASSSGKWRRVGDSMELELRVDTTGIPTSTLLTAALPVGHVIDTAKLTSGTATGLGSTMIIDGSTGIRYAGSPSVATNTTFAFQIDGTTSGVTQIVPFAWDNPDFMTSRVTVPIVGWSAGAMLSTTEASLTTVNFRARGNGGEVITADSEDIPWVVESDPHGTWDGTKFTAPLTGDYIVSGGIRITGGGTGAAISAYINGSAKHLLTSNFSSVLFAFSEQVHLLKGDDLSIRTNLGFTLSNTPTQHTLTIQGLPDFSVFSVFGETEKVEASSAGLVNYTVTADTWGNITSIPLTQGTWDIVADVTNYANGVTTAGNIVIGITALASTDPGTYGPDKLLTKFPNANATGSFIAFNKKGLVLTETTTIYLNTFVTTNITNCQVAYKLSARRIK